MASCSTQRATQLLSAPCYQDFCVVALSTVLREVHSRRVDGQYVHVEAIDCVAEFGNFGPGQKLYPNIVQPGIPLIAFAVERAVDDEINQSAGNHIPGDAQPQAVQKVREQR